jgi:hypothetical protein
MQNFSKLVCSVCSVRSVCSYAVDLILYLALMDIFKITFYCHGYFIIPGHDGKIFRKMQGKIKA